MARAITRNAGSAVTAILFGAFVLFGCTYIIVAKLWHLNAAAVTFIPIVVMIVYAVGQSVLRAARVRDDQAGDNLYYMGFLFTLTSLGISLYQFEVQGSAETIVQNFGIAIGSTIAGVALRVLFNQMRKDPVEVEQMARLELAEASRRVRRQLDASAVEFGHFQRGLQQALRDTFATIGKDVEEISLKLKGEMGEFPGLASRPIEAAAERSTAAFETMSGKITNDVEAAGNFLASESKRLATTSSEFSSSLEGILKELERTRTPEQIMTMQVEPIVGALAAAIDRFAGQASLHAAESARMREALERMSARDDERSSLMEDAVRGMQHSAAAIQEAASRLSQSAAFDGGPSMRYGSAAE